MCTVMVTIIGNGHSDLSSNPDQGCLHFYIMLIPLGKLRMQNFFNLEVNSRAN